MMDKPASPAAEASPAPDTPAAPPVTPAPVTPAPVTPAPVTPGAAAGRGREWRWRAGLGVIAALSALSYFWSINSDPLEGYYAAAVRSMSMNWHNFIFGAFDPDGTITLDKLPGAFWLQALSVRAFGLHTWAIALPQAIEGVLTVLVLYRAVRRVAGPGAGLIAALVIAASPATVALNRGNISDTLMILLLVLAADAVSGAIAKGSQVRLIAAGIWVGLAFQAKMIEAWLLLPALGLAYLIAARGSVLRRARQVVVAGVVTALVSLAWMAAVSLVPAAHRPYVDGSQHDSLTELVFQYNGFGRLGDQTPLQLLSEQSLGIDLRGSLPDQGPSAGRLLAGDLGRDTGWLLPVALLVAGWGIAARRREPRGDSLRACFVLWGTWLVTLIVTFSVSTTINDYYTAALSPAVAAILGAGLATAWSSRQPGGWLMIGAAAAVAGTAGYAAWLLSTGRDVPGWLIPVVLAAGAAAVAVALPGLPVLARLTVLARLPVLAKEGASRRMLAATLGAGLVALILAPAAASAAIVGRERGSFDTPYEAPSEAAAIRNLFVTIPVQVQHLIPNLIKVQFGAPDLLATQSSALASVFIYDSGKEALPIGGFTGTIPSPTLAALKKDIATGRFHLAILSAQPNRDPRLDWIRAHCLPAKGVDPALQTYFCLAPGTRPGAVRPGARPGRLSHRA